MRAHLTIVNLNKSERAAFVKCDIFHCYMQINLGFPLLENSNKFVRHFLSLIDVIYLHWGMGILAINHIKVKMVFDE